MPKPGFTGGDAIAQMFDWHFTHVGRAIPLLAALGYGAVHISPPQRSNEAAWQWWGRYQPVGYEIGGPLGSAAEFSAMARIAGAHGIRVVADVVLRNPCGPGGMLCGVSLADPARAFQAGFDYLGLLATLGADGFRFDGADAIPPTFFRFAAPRLDGALLFGEIVSDSVRDLARYAAVPGMRMLDFPLLATMRAAFAPGGDLRLLRAPEAAGRALPLDVSVAFARNHDIERGQAADKGIEDSVYRARFGVGWNEDVRRLDRAAIDLAHAWLFARRGGVPYTFVAMRTLPDAGRVDRLDDRIIAAGLSFRSRCNAAGDLPQLWRIASPTALAWQRGGEMFAVINGGLAPHDLAGLATSLRPGVYRDIANDHSLAVNAGGGVAHGGVPARSAALYVFDDSAAPCLSSR